AAAHTSRANRRARDDADEGGAEAPPQARQHPALAADEKREADADRRRSAAIRAERVWTDRETDSKLVVEAVVLGVHRPVRVVSAPVLPVGADRCPAARLEEMGRSKRLPAGEDDASPSHLAHWQPGAMPR